MIVPCLNAFALSGRVNIICWIRDTEMLATRTGTLCTIVSKIPGLGELAATFDLLLRALSMQEKFQYGQVLGAYKKYTWGRNGSYWYHVVWTTDSNGDGIQEYVTCKVETYP